MVVTFAKLKEEVEKHSPSVSTRSIYLVLLTVEAFLLTLGYAILGLFLVTYVLSMKYYMHAITVVLLLSIIGTLYVINTMAKDKEYYDSICSASKKFNIVSGILLVVGTLFLVYVNFIK